MRCGPQGMAREPAMAQTTLEAMRCWGKHFHSLMMELEKKSQVSGLAWSTAVNVAVTENADVGFFLEHPRWKSA